MSKVVITGLGTINPIAKNKDDFLLSLKEGRDGIRKIAAFDVSNYRFKTGGEVLELDVNHILSNKELQRTDRASQLLLAAAHEAVMDSGIMDLMDESRHNVSLITGTTLGGLKSGESFYRQLKTDSTRVRPAQLLDASLHAANDWVMCKYGFNGLSVVISTACSASAHAIGYGFDLIRSNQSNIVIAGGFEVMSELTFSGFGILRAITVDKIRPFDKGRSGLVLGEGAGIIVLEEFNHAKRRNAQIYCEVAGYGSSSDAHHMTAPHPKGQGALRAMEKALKDGNIAAEKVDYINAHGTATRLNDAAEAMAIKTLFKHKTSNTPVSSTKSMIGHLLGAAGAVESAATIMSIYHNIVPPTINYQELDPECNIDVVPNKARQMKINIALSNSFGFGGNNAVLIFRKF